MWIFLLLLLVLGLGVFATYNFIWKKNKSIHDSNGQMMPGSMYPFQGLELLSTKIDSWTLAEKTKESHIKYGPLFQSWLGLTKVVFVGEPNLLQNLLKTNVDGVQLRRLQFTTDPLAEAMMGESVIRKDSHEWYHQRMILEPAFRYSHLRQIIDVFCQGAHTVVEEWKKLNSNQQEVKINVIDWMSRLTLDMIGRAGFGFDFGASIEKPTMAPYTKAYNDLMTFLLSPLRILGFFIPGFSGWKFIPQVRNAYQSLDKLNDLMLEVIENRKKTHLQEPSSSQESSRRAGEKDLLELMLDASKSESTEEDEYDDHTNSGSLQKTDENEVVAPLNTKQLKDNLFLLFIAGHETSASTLTWSLYEFSKNLDIQKRAREEIDQLFEQKKKQPQNKEDYILNFQDLAKLEYLHAFVREALRLWNPAPLFARSVAKESECKEPLKIGDYLIPPSAFLFFSAHTIHHDEKLWAEPYKFDPERFLKENSTTYQHPFAWIPFSAGPRACIATKFALLEIKAILAVILRNFEVRADPSYKLQIGRDITLRPQNLHLFFKPREHL